MTRAQKTPWIGVVEVGFATYLLSADDAIRLVNLMRKAQLGSVDLNSENRLIWIPEPIDRLELAFVESDRITNSPTPRPRPARTQEAS